MQARIITGDLPTPVKYYNKDIKTAYKELEKEADLRLFSMLPDDLKEAYEPYFSPAEQDKELWRLCKAADKISALIKCIEEGNMGNPNLKRPKNPPFHTLKSWAYPRLRFS